MDSTLVIKAKCGDTLRRFNIPINENGQLDVDMGGLRAKILALFNLPPGADVILTYVDEDGDVVTLVDDDDLVDVMKQTLKFLRIDVQLKNDKFAKPYARSSSSSASTPMRSPRAPCPIPNLNAGVADVLKSLPDPVREVISKLSLDLASKAACSSSVVGELVDCLSKMVLNQAQQSPADASSSTTAENVGTVPIAANSGNTQEVKVENVTRGVGRSPTATAAPPVDLNLIPPVDSHPPQCATNTSAPTVGKSSLMFHAPAPVPPQVPTNTSEPFRPVANECPFSGMPVPNTPHVPPFKLPRITPFKRSSGISDATLGMFHKGVQCDGCGVLPITGPRYKSKVREDYDLCSICFKEMGNEADYVKIEWPVSHRHLPLSKRLDNFHHWVRSPAGRVIGHHGMKSVRGKLDSRFIMDVNVLDGTLMAPLTQFTKIWRLRNSGNMAWPRGSRLVWVGGDKFSHADSAELEIPVTGVPVDGELDVAVDFTAPGWNGRYLSYWRMASPSGAKFGQRVWVLINVDASLKETVSGLNLNLAPECSGSKGPEVIDVNASPSGVVEPCSSAAPEVSAPVLPMPCAKLLEKDGELNFTVKDSLLFADGPTNFTPLQSSDYVSYPIIDLSEAGPSEAFPVANAPVPSQDTSLKEDVESSLLKELEEMGFRQVDLNKEILRMNEYDLEQSVDALCGVSEWDPMLDELEEMGFRNKDLNRNLLKKNKGSIKDVVMDLLTGEKP